MTREEAIAILDGFKYNPLLNEQHFEALDMAVTALSENKGEWIPVTERLPEENVHVLITVLHEGKTYVTTDDYFCYGFDDWKDDVIAWQPLPEPYKAESEDKE